jgi:hypothetical protein
MQLPFLFNSIIEYKNGIFVCQESCDGLSAVALIITTIESYVYSNLIRAVKNFFFNLYPFPWIFACVDEIGFRAALFGYDIVFPSCGLRKTHEDAFDSSTSLEAKNGSPIVHQVEFDISSAAHQLPFLFLLCEFVVLVRSDDGSVSFDDRVQTFFRECKVLVGFLVVLIVEEDSSQTTSFVSVLDNEITVGP